MSQRPPILRYFASGHLPPQLAQVAIRFEALADWVAANLPGSAEQSTALRKLLEAKDAAVRAALDPEDPTTYARPGRHPEAITSDPDTWPTSGMFSPRDGA